MRIFREPAELQGWALDARRAGVRIGLVPTMGFLHAGHLSLIDVARKRSDAVVVSIFVNPTQFGPGEDLSRYPRSFESDCRACEEHGAAAVFAPADGAMYAPGHSIWVNEEELSCGLCGRSRPGHFRGVATVVAKLFNLALPEVAVFGQKDAQQALIIRRLARDLNFPLEVVIAPLVRDADGVALSSRNRYLSEEERARARTLSQTLFAIRDAVAAGGTAALPGALDAGRQSIRGEIDYLEALDAATLGPVGASTQEILVAAAAKFGDTRLIDNILVKSCRP